MADGDREPVAEPMPRRLEEALRAGDVPLSPGLTAWVSLTGAAVALAATVGASLVALASWARASWDVSGIPIAPVPQLGSGATIAARVVAPIAITAVAAAAIAGLLQTGGRWSWPTRPGRAATSRAWPAMRGWLLVLALAVALAGTAHDAGRTFFGLFGAAPAAFAEGLARAVTSGLTWLMAAAGSVWVVDWIVRRRAWTRRLAMTPQELRREQREDEGDPWLAQRRRQAHRDLWDDPPGGA